MTWAALIKCVYEVDPLKCLRCGGEMRIISFIEEELVIEKILRHCGLWKQQAPRPPSEEKPPPEIEESKLDYGFFEKTCARKTRYFLGSVPKPKTTKKHV